MSLAEFLKDKTRKEHALVEKAMGAKRLFDPNLKRSYFEEHLLLLYKAHAAISGACDSFRAAQSLESFWPIENYSSLLRQDLNSFSLDVPELKSSFKLDNQWQCLGTLYVINGSSLGRHHIAKALKNKFVDWGVIKSSFYHLDHDPNFWPAYRQSLAALNLTEHEEETVLQGALKCFEFFRSLSVKTSQSVDEAGADNKDRNQTV